MTTVRPTGTAVTLMRVELPAAPHIGYASPQTVFFISLDGGETFYPTATDPTYAPLAALDDFWQRCQGVADEKGVVHGRIAATRRGIRQNGWPSADITWTGAAPATTSEAV